MAKQIDYEAVIKDTLLNRCETQSEMLEELESFFGADKLYTKEFAESLIDRWDISEEDVDEFYSEG